MGTDNIKIYVCSHKKDFTLNDDLFVPIQVGKAISSKDLGFIGDDTGDNISEKNRSYCELTALYWIWKNSTESDVLGLAHYRRYLDIDRRERQPIYKIPKEVFERYSFSKEKIKTILGKHDIIAAKPIVSPHSLYIDYCHWHISDDLRILESVIHELTPEYDDAFFDVMKNNNKQRGFNMLIASRSIFNDYCEWLFTILFEVERRVHIENYNVAQSRIFGYMGERLLNVYIKKHNLRVYDAPVAFVNDDLRGEVPDWYYYLRYFKANLAFRIGNSPNNQY